MYKGRGWGRVVAVWWTVDRHPLRCPEWWTLVWSLEEGGGQQVEQMIIEGSCKVGWKCSRHTSHCRLLSV